MHQRTVPMVPSILDATVTFSVSAISCIESGLSDHKPVRSNNRPPVLKEQFQPINVDSGILCLKQRSQFHKKQNQRLWESVPLCSRKTNPATMSMQVNAHDSKHH
jgi:hypothetical protein